MGTSAIHPSQRRLSCDVCRRHKTRCLRIRQNDLKCARCTMLGEECNISGQKKVGRPRKSDLAPGQHTGVESTEEPQVKPVRLQKTQTFAENQQSDPSRSSVSSDSGISLEMNDKHGIEGMMFSRTTIPTTTTSKAVAPAVGTTPNVIFALESSWPAAGTAELQTSSLPRPVPWKISSCFKHSSAFADYDWNMNENENDALKTRLSQSDLTVICSDPASLVIPELGAPMGSIDLSDALSNLSKLNNDLFIRIAAIKSYQAVITLNSILFREGPLFINNLTLGEFTMKSTQELFQVLSQLLNNQQCRTPLDSTHKLDILQERDGQSSSLHLYRGRHHSHSQGPSPNLTSPFPSAFLQPLPAPLALIITAVFTQLISLYEVVLRHMILWVENIAAEPLRPIPGLQITEAWPQDLYAQGIRFSNASLNFLERIEQILGLTGRPEWGGPALLSIRQIDLLWSVLDDSEGIAPSHGFMRPVYVKMSLQKALSVLSRVIPQ